LKKFGAGQIGRLVEAIPVVVLFDIGVIFCIVGAEKKLYLSQFAA
jgi:hypothetical protein